MQGLAEGNEKIVELSNGCMCCGMKDDLLRQIYAIAREACYDVLVVEGSGVAEPMPIAEGIASYDIRGGATLDTLVKLDTLVTVVDALDLPVKDLQATPAADTFVVLSYGSQTHMTTLSRRPMAIWQPNL